MTFVLHFTSTCFYIYIATEKNYMETYCLSYIIFPDTFDDFHSQEESAQAHVKKIKSEVQMG